MYGTKAPLRIKVRYPIDLALVDEVFPFTNRFCNASKNLDFAQPFRIDIIFSIPCNEERLI